MIDEENAQTQEKELAALEEKKAKRREEKASARKSQELIDARARDSAEEEHGFDRIRVLHTPYFFDGLPTIVIVKSPGGTSYWKRFQDQIRNSKGNKQMESAAQDQLARASIVYPTAETLGAMCKEWPNLLNDASGAAARLGKMDSEDEKKD